LKYIKNCGCALLGAWQLAEFMVMQRRGNVLLNKFLNRRMKMMQVMYVLLSNMYAADANWDLQEKVE
jgi:hypothetical protein